MQSKVILLPEYLETQTNKKQVWKMKIKPSAISLWSDMLCRDQIVWSVGGVAFFIAGMHITLAWRRWCRCSVKWSWSSHCSSWMQTWTPRTISQHYFLWVLLHLTFLWAWLLVCRSPSRCPRCFLAENSFWLSLKPFELFEFMSLFVIYRSKSELKLLYLLRTHLRL